MLSFRKILAWTLLSALVVALIFFSPILLALGQGILFRETYIIPESRSESLSIIEYGVSSAPVSKGRFWRSYEIPGSGYLRSSSNIPKHWHRIEYKIRRTDGSLIEQRSQDWDSYFSGGKQVIFRKGIEHKGPTAEEIINANQKVSALLP